MTRNSPETRHLGGEFGAYLQSVIEGAAIAGEGQRHESSECTVQSENSQ